MLQFELVVSSSFLNKFSTTKTNRRTVKYISSDVYNMFVVYISDVILTKKRL